MKKIIIFLFLFLVSVSVNAKEDYSWSDFDRSCFTKMAEINILNLETFKVEIDDDVNPLFVQGNKFLANKIYEKTKEEYVDYSVLNEQGLKAGGLEDAQKYLNDGNLNTSINFDPYFTGTRQIIIDAGEILEVGSFKFNFEYKAHHLIRFYISENGEDYINVKHPEDFNFRFLKIEFEDLNKRVNENYNLSIKELNLIKKGNSVFLLNPESKGLLNIYVDYKCEDKDKLREVFNEINIKSRQANFSTDIYTSLIDINLKDNIFYDSDFDNDNILNDEDNCPFDFNPNQGDVDGDLMGDVCDFDNEVKNFNDKDSDSDGVADSLDNCVYIYNPKQLDSNASKYGDLCSDNDKDGVVGYLDNCVYVYNPKQEDVNVNKVGDACEFDKDNDGIFDSLDNCISIYNPNQLDQDNDDIGDKCDNCDIYNPRQIDKNNNNIGDKCEENAQKILENDKDGDTILNYKDNCPEIMNFNQEDEDGDGVGDKCDNCLGLKNPKQEDKNNNRIGDMCEDADQDGIVGYLDNCQFYANADQADQDNDGVGDVCEDDDRDGFVAIDDNCPFDFNKDQSDIDKDGIGDKCDDHDNRFLESNKGLFIGFIIFITIIFVILIILMMKKIKTVNQSVNNNKENQKDLK